MKLPDATSPSFALDPAQLQKAISLSLEILTQHLRSWNQTPVRSQHLPGALAKDISPAPPNEAKDIEDILHIFQKQILPAVTHWQHPRFFSYYPASTSIPAIISEMLMASIGSVGLQWSANPAATELECVVMDWLLDLLNSPLQSPYRHSSKQGGGLIQNTAGEAMAIIMVAARIDAHKKRLAEELKGGTISMEDLYWQDSSKLVVYMSDQTHFSGPKAVRVAGMRTHKIKAQRLANENFGITSDQVRQAMEADRQQGLIPVCVFLNYGSTNTCGYDDLESFKGFRDEENIWLHVDAAYAGPSLILPEFKERSLLIQEISTSFNFNGSKWFLAGFDSAFLFIRDRRLLKQVFTADGDYLARVEDEQVYNPEFKDWSIPLGRRFRSLRIWMVLCYFGRDGLRSFLRKTIAQADYARRFIDASEHLTQVVKTELGLVCFRLKSESREKREAFIRRIEELSENGTNFLLYPSMLEGESILRLALGGVHTEQRDIDYILDICQKAAREVSN